MNGAPLPLRVFFVLFVLFHTILVASRSVDEFLAGVRAAGLTVQE